VPSFTNNWLARQNPGRLPVSFSRFDMATIVASAVALLGWIATPIHPVTGILFLIAGCLQALRLVRWAGDRAVADRLVLILHAGYAFVPLGFLLGGATVFVDLCPPSAGVHAWTAGAIGLMTLAVMTRATLGHTGRRLQAGRMTQVVYAAVLIAAVARILAAFAGSIGLLEFAAMAWICGFALFVVVLCWSRTSRRGRKRAVSSRWFDRRHCRRSRHAARPGEKYDGGQNHQHYDDNRNAGRPTAEDPGEPAERRAEAAANIK